jgi:hypothetical protein
MRLQIYTIYRDGFGGGIEMHRKLTWPNGIVDYPILIVNFATKTNDC